MLPRIFDPLLYLNELHVFVNLDQSGQILLKLDSKHSPENIALARAMAKTYTKLISLQIREGRASVQKLIAHGKIMVSRGKYFKIKRRNKSI